MKLDICSLMVAERNMTEANKVLILNFLNSQFKDMSANDIEEAVKMYLGKKLICDASYCVKMSAEYLGIILASFRAYKRDMEAEKRKQLPVAKKVEVIDEDNYFEICNYIERNVKLPEWGSNIYLSAYNHLVTLVYTPTDDEKKEFAKGIKNKKQQQIEFLKTQGLTQNIRDEVNRITNEISRPTDFANHCRVEYIKDYLTKKYLK